MEKPDIFTRAVLLMEKFEPLKHSRTTCRNYFSYTIVVNYFIFPALYEAYLNMKKITARSSLAKQHSVKVSLPALAYFALYKFILFSAEAR